MLSHRGERRFSGELPAGKTSPLSRSVHVALVATWGPGVVSLNYLCYEDDFMEERIIDQLLYTRSDVGLGNLSVGYRVRAASPGLENIRGERYRSVDRFLRYQFPPDINPNTLSPQDAP